MFVNLSKKICLFLLLVPTFSHISFTKSTPLRKRKTATAKNKRYSKKEVSTVAAVPTKNKRYGKRARFKRPHLDTPWKKLTEKQHIDLLAHARLIKDTELELRILLQLSKTAKLNSNLKKYLLELADFYFENKKLEKAIEYYKSYSLLYPASQEAEYASYKAIIASFYSTLKPFRDQTPTENTIKLATEFLKEVIRKDYKDEVKTIIKACTKKLFQHEVYIFDHYIKQKKFKPAKMRLDYIKKNFINKVKDVEKIIPRLEKVLKGAKDPKTRPFFVGVNFDYIDPTTTWNHQKRRVRRIKL